MEVSLFFILGVLIFFLIGQAFLYFHRHDHQDEHRFNREANIIEAFAFVFFFGIAFFLERVSDYKGIFTYFTAFAFTGLLLEYFLDWLWLRTTGVRMYRYYRKNLLGFTSWFTLPYWGMAGLFFYGLWDIFHYSVAIHPFELVKVFVSWGGMILVAVVFLYSIHDFIRHKLNDARPTFGWRVCTAFSISTIGATVMTLVDLNATHIIPYVLTAGLLALLFEGLLGKMLCRTFGTHFWYYYRYTLFDHTTSWLVVPIWAGASMFALFWMSIFLF